MSINSGIALRTIYNSLLHDFLSFAKMLRGRSSSRLNRRKSTSSVYSKYEPIDPEVARRHARAAARLAFDRGQARMSQTDVSSSGSFAKNISDLQQESRHHAPVAQSVRRQQSVRFAGARASRRTDPLPHTRSAPVEMDVAMAMTTNAPVPAAYRPPSRTSSIGKGSISKASNKHLLMVNNAFDEHYTREDDVASTPSSYRRIRRSKSMLSPSKAPSVFYTNGTPGSNVPSMPRKKSFMSMHRRSQDENTGSVLRTPKSMSFLRGRSEMERRISTERNDAAVQMARDKFFTQSSQQRLREQPSFLFRARAQRQERSFRKSVRSSSGTQGYGAPISSSIPEPANESTIKEAARKASKSLRSRLKRVFGRTGNNDGPLEIPNQQVFAKETHVRRYLGDNQEDQHQYNSRPLEPSVWQINSRVPSLHTVNSNQHLRSQNGSVRSVRSARSTGTDRGDDKSRVTSWTSTGVNTLNSLNAHHTFAEREMQRLSVIKENGTHIPSSSFRRIETHGIYPPYSQTKYQEKENNTLKSGDNTRHIDSARVYSALMKRIETNDQTPIIPLASTSKQHSSPISQSSQRIRKSRSQATIRRVTSQDKVSLDHSQGLLVVRNDQTQSYPLQPSSDFLFAQNSNNLWVGAAQMSEETPENMDDVFSVPSTVANKENVPPSRSAPSHRSNISRQASIDTLHHIGAGKNMLTPQEMANRNEHPTRASAPRMLRDSQSTFFGGTSTFTVSRTPSPFRRVLAESDNRSDRVEHQQRPLHQFIPRRLSPLRNPLYCATSSGTSTASNIEPEVAYSESVYSRTTSGQLPGQNASPAPSAFAENKPIDPSTGDAVIIDRAIYRPSIPVRKQHKVSTSTSSVDWQKWMSSEVAKLERSKDTLASLPYVNYAMPTMPTSGLADQIREKMHISGGDADRVIEVIRKPVVRKPSGPTGSISHAAPLRPILKSRSATSLSENGLEDNHEKLASRPPPPPPPPPLPPSPFASRLPLRRMQSKSSAETLRTPGPQTTVSAPASTVKSSSLNGRHVLHKRNSSTTTLKSAKSDHQPNKLTRQPRQSQSHNRFPNRGPIVGICLQRDNYGSASSRTYSSSRSIVGGLRRANQETSDMYYTDGAGLMGPATYAGIGECTKREAQSAGSKKMVDMFLSSRRKRIASTSEDGGAGQAFI